MTDWLSTFNRIPPDKCRGFARSDDGDRPLTNDEIAKRSGLARSTIAKLSKLKSWDGISARIIYQYSTACRVDLLYPGRNSRHLKRGRVGYIRNATPKQRKMLARIFPGTRPNGGSDGAYDAGGAMGPNGPVACSG